MGKQLKVSATTVSRWLKPLGYSLKTNIKRIVGKVHPDRDRQYRFIQRTKDLFIRHHQPVISVDAKKTELIGNFKNQGTRYCQQADAVNLYDFPSQAEGKAIPYGIYDAQAAQGWVNVGISAATPEFAVASITQWWQQVGQARYPSAQQLLIEADAGGCNDHRSRMWKYGLQQLANQTGLTITVRHYPTGASKWNPIEHRLFSQISRNWAGIPLRSYERMLALIRGTTTTKGLCVEAALDLHTYQKGLKVTDQQMQSINLKRQRLCPNLNYSIRPQIVESN